MGVCVSDEFANDDLIDLEKKKSHDGDAMSDYQYSLPFSRTYFYTYLHLLKQAHEQSGGEGYITFIAMSETFNTPAWKSVRDPHSPLSMMLSKYCKYWKKEKSYDYLSMLMLGLLFSRDAYEPKAKAEEFWDLL